MINKKKFFIGFLIGLLQAYGSEKHDEIQSIPEVSILSRHLRANSCTYFEEINVNSEVKSEFFLMGKDKLYFEKDKPNAKKKVTLILRNSVRL